jgi:fluoride ion exporter CrcB/FEX
MFKAFDERMYIFSIIGFVQGLRTLSTQELDAISNVTSWKRG